MQQPSAAGQYFFLGLALVCAVIFADQYSKWWVIGNMLRTDTTGNLAFLDWFFTQKKIAFFVNEREAFRNVVLTPFLNFVMVWNQGISFGLFDTNSYTISLVFIAISMVVSLLMLIWLAIATQKRLALPLSLMIGGALANVIDRIRFGAVADFIDVHLGTYHWPAFNLADSCITMGAMLLILVTFIGDRGKNAQASS